MKHKENNQCHLTLNIIFPFSIETMVDWLLCLQKQGYS